MYVYLRKLKKVKDPKQKKDKPKKTVTEPAPEQNPLLDTVFLNDDGHYLVSEDLGGTSESDIHIVDISYPEEFKQEVDLDQPEDNVLLEPSSPPPQLATSPPQTAMVGGKMIVLQKLKKIKEPIIRLHRKKQKK